MNQLSDLDPLVENPENKDELAVEELFLLHLRYREGSLVDVGANKPILLDDPETTWVVYDGQVDIFAIETKQGNTVGPRTHLIRIEGGQAMFGIKPATNNTTSLLAVGGNNTRLLKMPTHRLQQIGQEEEYQTQVSNLIDYWVKELSAYLAPALPPKECIRLDADSDLTLTDQGSACAKKNILWIQQKAGHLQFMGNTSLTSLQNDERWPLSNHTWLLATEESELSGITTKKLITQDTTWSNLQHFHQLVCHYISLNADQIATIEKQKLYNKTIVNQNLVDGAFKHLAITLAAPQKQLLFDIETQEPLLQACQLVGRGLNINIQVPLSIKGEVAEDPLKEIAKVSRFRIRRVALKGEWWKYNSGPLLAYIEESKQPVALLPTSGNKYEIHDPVVQTTKALTESVANDLEYFGYMFYQPFPDQAMNALNLLKFGVQNHLNDIRTIFVTGIVVGLLTLFIPIVTGIIFDRIIPDADISQLYQLSLILFVVALAIALFQITQNLAILRLRGKLSVSIQAGVWDRLLSLPVSFFRNYNSGDLGTRVMGISIIEQTLSGLAIGAILSGIFSIFNLLLLFYYNVQLALTATGLVLISISATVLAGYVQVRYQREMTEIQGTISGIVLQTITGITKFRAAGAEGRAFAFWAKDFSYFKQLTYKARNVTNNLAVFNSGYNIIAMMIIFAVFAFTNQSQIMSTGMFVAFSIAFIQFLTAVFQLNITFMTILNIVPTYERAQPILQALPEVDAFKASPKKLNGRIEVSHVSFKYYEDAPLVLKNVSLQAYPGEFVALVGSSGSGKTTLFRILLGFEKPNTGAVYYNRQDLAGLDVREVRRQVGVVLQNDQVLVGDIFTNIIGSSLLTLDDAWEAARMAGLEDDIKQMPMGMHTIISAGGGTLSGGQRQRLLIARAIVHKPRILFFDEATSALDNKTQAIVSQSLENLQATRIVIAHRLSTIMNADRIYVFQHGEVVQSGTYEELKSQPGLFAELAERQLT